MCAVSNYIRTPTRPEWIAHRDFTPIEPVADDALLNYARAAKSNWAREQGLSLQTPIIVKYRDEKTDAATALESWLR